MNRNQMPLTGVVIVAENLQHRENGRIWNRPRKANQMTDYQKLADALKDDIGTFLYGNPSNFFTEIMDGISKTVDRRIADAEAQDTSATPPDNSGSKKYIEQLKITVDIKELLRRCYNLAFDSGVNKGYHYELERCWDRDKYAFEDTILEIARKITAKAHE
jgi:hypothetical protein